MTTSFAVIVNGGPNIFTALRGLRKGDPLSPLLFIIVMEALNKLLDRAKELKLLQEIFMGHRGNQIELTHLFFVDDAFIFCHPDIRSLIFLKCILLCFQAVPGLKTNLHKSELVVMGTQSSESLAQILDYKVSQLSILYLGAPFGAKYKDRKCWDPIIDMFQN